MTSIDIEFCGIDGKDLFYKYYIVYSQYSSNLVCIYNKLCVHVKITVYN